MMRAAAAPQPSTSGPSMSRMGGVAASDAGDPPLLLSSHLLDIASLSFRPHLHYPRILASLRPSPSPSTEPTANGNILYFNLLFYFT